MVQNFIIVATPYPPSNTYTGSLSLHITYFWTSATASVSPPDRPTILPPIYPSFTPSLLTCADKKEVTSLPQIILRPPNPRHVLHTFPLMLKLGTV